MTNEIHDSGHANKALGPPHFAKTRRKASAWKVTNIASNVSNAAVESIEVGANDSQAYQVTSTTDVVVPRELPELGEKPSDAVGNSTAIEVGPTTNFRVDEAHKHVLQNRHQSKSKTIRDKSIAPGEAGSTESNSDQAKAFPNAEHQPLNSFLVPLMDLAMMPSNKVVPSADSFAPTFAADEYQENLEFEPNWEVDSFQIPDVAHNLLVQCDPFLTEFTQILSNNILLDEKRLVVTGVKCGEGRTTLAITFAKKLIDQGQRICVVDADLVNPDLADRLGLDNEISWLTDQAEFESAAEFLIRNSEDRLCVLPLTPSNRVSFAKHAYEILDELVDRIEPYFDRVIIDFGPVSHIDASTFRAMNFAECALLIHDPKVSDVFEYSRAFDKFRTFGLTRFALLKNSTRA